MGVGDHGDRVLSGGVEILEFREGVFVLSVCLGLIAVEVLLCCLSRPYLCHMPYWNSGVGGMCWRGRCFSCRFDRGFAGGVVGVVHIAVV